MRSVSGIAVGWRRAALAWLVLLCAGPALAAPERALPVIVDPTFGTVRFYAPRTKPTSVIVLLSDANGFGRDETRLALDFVVRGSLVIGLSWPEWRAKAAERRSRDCDDLLGRIEDIVFRTERDRNIAPFITPVLAGMGMGGSAVRALAPAAASHRIGGVVALRAGAFLPSSVPLCGAIAHQRDGGFVYEAPPPAAAASLHEAQDENDAAEAAEDLAETAGPHGPGDLADLPLFVDVPSRAATRLAVLLTGDGGMGAVDKGLADALAARGIAVVTIDSRRYFWTKRTVPTVARDIERIITHYQKELPIKRIGLAGYSFGADVLPLAYGKLPAKTRAAIASVSLLGLATAIDLKVEFNDADYPNALPLLPDAARIDAPSVQCIYGENDPSAAMACPALGTVRPGVVVRKTSGGHGFDGDIETLADIVSGPLLAPPHHHHHVVAPAAVTAGK